MIAPDRKVTRVPPARDTESAAEHWTGFLLSQCAHRLRSATSLALAPLSLTPRDVGALEVLARDQPTQVELGRAIGLDRTTVVAVVDHLEQLGCIERRSDRADRRVNRLRLTAAGEQTLEGARRAAASAELQVLGALSDRERVILRRLLAKLWRSTPGTGCG